MHRLTFLVLAAGCALSTACTTRGGGRLGVVLFNPDQHVSGAEPLFGDDEERCFRDPTYGLSFVMPSQPMIGHPVACQTITTAVRAALGAPSSGSTGQTAYLELQRNEIIESFMSSSNYVCGDHIRFLQQYDGNINSILGIGAQASAGLAAIVTGGTAQAAAALAALLGGARGTMNNAHFNNKTVGMLTSAFQAARKTQRDELTLLEAKPVKDFPLSNGIERVLDYHNSCSITVGLAEAQRAVDEAHNPSFETFKTFMTNLHEVRAEMAKFVKATEDPKK